MRKNLFIGEFNALNKIDLNKSTSGNKINSINRNTQNINRNRPNENLNDEIINDDTVNQENDYNIDSDFNLRSELLTIHMRINTNLKSILKVPT